MLVILVYDLGTRFIMMLYFIMLVSNYSMFYVFFILRGYSQKFHNVFQEHDDQRRSLLSVSAYEQRPSFTPYSWW
jgi:hypothetical protein